MLFAKQKLDIDMARAEAGERSASEIAALQDDRAASAGLKADALTAQADQLRGKSTGAFIDAGVSALQAGVSLAGSIQGKAGNEAAEKLAASEGISIDDARSQISKYTRKEIRQFNRGDISAIDVSGRSNITGDVSVPEDIVVDNTQTLGESIAGVSNTPVGTSIEAMLFNFINEQKEKNKEEEAAAVYDFYNVLNSLKNLKI